MTTKVKAIWNSTEVTVLGLEHKSPFGDLVKIDCNGETKIVNSHYIEKIKTEERFENE